jgi:Flp pilus assembly protein TadB
MILDYGAPLLEESPSPDRILAIEDQIAALDRIRPKTRHVWLGTTILVFIVCCAILLVTAGTASSNIFLPAMLIAVASTIFAFQLTRNTRRRHRLERELNALIAPRARRDP